MKKLLSLLFVLCYCLDVYTQAPAVQFNRAFGGTDYDAINALAKTNDGGYIVAGSTLSTDGDFLNAGIQGWQGDCMIMKFSAAGTVQWVKLYGGFSSERVNDIQQAADGGYILTGITNSTNGDFLNTGTGGFLIKTYPDGTMQWQAKVGNMGNTVIQAADGGYVVGGDYYIKKFNSTGQLLWTYTTTHIIRSLCEISDGGYAATGEVYTFRGNDLRITLISGNGAMEREMEFGGFGDDSPNAIVQTSDGGYAVAGTTSSNNNGNVSGYHGGTDIWVVKLTNMLELSWQKCLGGTGNETGWNIAEGTSRELIITGESTSSNGDVVLNNGSADGWIAKLSQDGFLLWQQTLGGTEYDSFRRAFQATDDGYIVAGFSASADGGISGFHFSPAVLPDIWLVKLGADVSDNLPLSNQSTGRNIQDNLPVSFRDGERRRIATVQANGPNPVRGNVTAEVWAGDPVHGSVSRRYQVTPANNAASSCARITLYYLQYEFTAYNEQVNAANRLPSSPTDNIGKANFRFVKYSDDVVNPGPPVIIDPLDNDIVWNATNEYWEVSFDVTSFSTFVAMDAVSAAAISLPVAFGAIDAFIKDGMLTVNWTSLSETNQDYYLVEASADGKQFTTVSDKIYSKATAGNSTTAITYSFTKNYAALQAITLLVLGLSLGYKNRKHLLLPGLLIMITVSLVWSCKKSSSDIKYTDDQQLYIRVVQVDKGGTKSYSKIINVIHH